MTRTGKRSTRCAGQETTPVDTNTVGLRYLRRRIEAALEDVVTAVLATAVGTRYVYEKDSVSGQWVRVTDPDQVAVLLALLCGEDASGRQVIVSTQDPDARLLEGLLVFYLHGCFDPECVPALVDMVVNAATGETTVQVNGDCLGAAAPAARVASAVDEACALRRGAAA